MKKIRIISLILLTLSLCVGCTEGGRRGAESFDSTIYEPLYASGYTIDVDANANTLIRVTRPWQGSALEEQTLAIFANEEMAEGYSGQYIVGAAERVVCMSSSHIAMLDAIGCVDAVVGVSGKQYITNRVVVQDPAIKDIGYDSSLDYESILMLKPDVVLMYGVSAANDAVTA
jgi:iron complex transport system substrate-binding protein